MRSRLVALDFDHTIVEENSDVEVRNMLPPGMISGRVEALRKCEGWTGYMQEIFDLLYRFKFTERDISSKVRGLSETPNMLSLLGWFRDNDWETIIISDANSYFIREWLRGKNVRPEGIFTNPAEFVGGRLTIKKYHEQNWCDLSTRNLCKGRILEDYVLERRDSGVEFETIAYIGDGKNDYCPSLALGENDHVFPRAGYPLDEILNEKNVRAHKHPWTDATQIIDVLAALD